MLRLRVPALSKEERRANKSERSIALRHPNGEHAPVTVTAADGELEAKVLPDPIRGKRWIVVSELGGVGLPADQLLTAWDNFQVEILKEVDGKTIEIQDLGEELGL